MHKSKLEIEMERLDIELKENEGILFLDLSTYIPNKNQNFLTLGASLSKEPCKEGEVLDMQGLCVLNHRYPNHNYVCLTRKHGRKLCEFGCPVWMSVEDLNAFGYLNLEYVFKNRTVKMSVPIELGLSDQKNCATIVARFDVDRNTEPELLITMFEPNADDTGWKSFSYGMSENPRVRNIDIDKKNGRFVRLTKKDGADGWIVFNETVKAFPAAVSRNMI